jgi:DNA-binding NarL/FixJ family response regulator
VLQLVVEGKTNQEIGLALGISEKTVEKHLEAVYAKLGVASRVEAAVHAVRAGLVPPAPRR